MKEDSLEHLQEYPEPVLRRLVSLASRENRVFPVNLVCLENRAALGRQRRSRWRIRQSKCRVMLVDTLVI